jgi:serine protease Do
MRTHTSRLMSVALLLVAALARPGAAQDRQPTRSSPTLADLDGSIEALVRTVDPSVVQIFTTALAPASPAAGPAELVTTQRASGSGVIVDERGYIVTNAHVVRGASRIRVEIPVPPTGQSLLARRARVVGAQLVGADEETDLAVLKVEGEGLRAVPFGDSDELRSGQVVLAFGSPLGLQNSVSLGIVSSVARQLEPDSPMVYIQTDAAISPGNSGGPLVDVRGRLVGVNTLLLSSAAGAGPGFAAPSNIVRAVFDQIRQYGRVRRGEIGVRAQTVTPTMAAGLGLARDQGAILADVVPGGPGDRAGLSIGDLIVSLDGKPIENGRQFQVNLYRRAVGEVVRLEVIRQGTRVSVSVAVAERADALAAATAIADPRQNLVPRLGILAVTLDPALADVVPGLRARAGVVVVSASAAAIDSENGSLQPGDIIHAVNGQWVSDLEALRAAVDAVRIGSALVLQVERRGGLLFLALTVE